jgi:hypothetical protein
MGTVFWRRNSYAGSPSSARFFEPGLLNKTADPSVPTLPLLLDEPALKPGYQLGASAGIFAVTGQRVPVPGVNVEYIGATSFNLAAGNINLNGVSLGDFAAADRKILLVLCNNMQSGSATQDTLWDGVTLDGNAMTEILQAGSTTAVSFFIIDKPTGSVGNFVLDSHSTDWTGSGYAFVYSLTGAGAVVDTARDTEGGAADLTDDIDLFKFGALIAGVSGPAWGTTPPSVAWTGVDEVAEVFGNVGLNFRLMGTAKYWGQAQTARIITADVTAGTGSSFDEAQMAAISIESSAFKTLSAETGVFTVEGQAVLNPGTTTEWTGFGFPDTLVDTNTLRASGAPFTQTLPLRSDNVVTCFFLHQIISGPATVVGVTIGGVAATKQAEISAEGGQIILDVWTANTGTDSGGDIDVEYTAPASGAISFLVHVWATVGADLADPIADADLQYENDSSNSVSASLDVPATGEAFAWNYGPQYAAGNMQANWTGLNEFYDEAFSNLIFSGALRWFHTAQAPLAITITDDASSLVAPSRAFWSVSTNPAPTGPDPLVADAGSFALTGQAATFRRSLHLGAVHGTFSLAGQPVTFNHAQTFGAGSFAFTGQNATLALFRNLSANNGAYTVTGQSISFNWAMQAGAGTFALNGQAASLEANYRLNAEAGSFALSGQDAEFPIGVFFLGQAGSFALAGQDAGLHKASRFAADHGSFALAGQGITFTFGLPAEAGSFALTGQAVDFSRDLRLDAGFGSYTLAGAATLTAARHLGADAGAFALTGQAATFSFRVTLEAGSFSLNGQAANIARLYTLTATPGTFTLTGQTVNLLRALPVVAEAGAFALTGQMANFDYNAIIPALNAGEGIFAVSGQAVTPKRALRLQADAGIFGHAGFSIGILRAIRVAGDAGSFLSAGQEVLTRRALRMAAENGAFAVTGAAQLPVARRVFGNVGTFLVAGQVVDLSRDLRLLGLGGAFTLVGPPVEFIDRQILVVTGGIYTATLSGVSFISGTPVTGAGVLTGRPLGDTVVEQDLTEHPLGDTVVEVRLTGSPLK